MNLKQSHIIHAFPLTLLPSTPPSADLEHEQQYLSRLRDSLSWIMSSMQASAREVSEKYMRREQCQRLLEEKDQAITALQNEVYQLRVAGEQYQRYLKRYEMKHELLNNKVYHLTKAIAEKDAIIKYLEGKALPAPPTPSASYAHPLNDSLHQCSRTYSKPNLSFAKLKSTPSLMKFEDYANCSLQLAADPTKRSKVERVRTQSSDVKQNQQGENVKTSGAINKLTSFFNTGMFSSVENQKTLTKAQSNIHQNSTFYQYSKPKPAQSRETRRHSNFTASSCLPPNDFYRE